MRTRPLTGALALGLALSLAGTLGLTTTADATADRRASSPAAERSLQQAEKLVAGKAGPSRDATEVMRQLWSKQAGLSRADARAAESILNRPTEPDDELGDYYGDGETVEQECGEFVCVHWAETGLEATTAEYAAEVLETVNDIHETYVDAGYKAPLPDDGQGVDTKPDVYIANIGDYAYGYCNTDQPEYRQGYTVYAFCVLDNDYSADEFGTAHSTSEFMQVTAAHEYFHAVQAAYDWEEDFWLLEATATWVEDEMFDHINDNVVYLPYGQLGGPESAGGYPVAGPAISLDLMNFNAYGNWIWFRYLTEKFTAEQGDLPTLVRDIWEAADSANGAADDQYSLEAIDSVLDERGSSLEQEYALFALENNTPETTYDEGVEQGYPKPDYAFPTTQFGTGGKSHRGQGRGKHEEKVKIDVRLDHMTSGTGAFVPSPAMGAGWWLEVELKMAANRGSQAGITYYRTNGEVRRGLLPLDRKGSGKIVLPFSSTDVSRVEVTLINSSDRMRTCDSGTPYACGGEGVDDAVKQQLRVKAFRR